MENHASLKKLETLEQEEEQSAVHKNEEQSSLMTELVSFPSEIIEEILSRHPVKSILQFRSVCKAWLSIISNPSFTKLQFSRATVSHHTGLIISIYDKVSHKHHFLSGAHDGGPLTHLMTLDKHPDNLVTGVTHVNGLVFITSSTAFNYIDFQAFVVNPYTRKVFKLPAPDFNTTFSYEYICYLFGFDESTNDHKILVIGRMRRRGFNYSVESMIFSMSNYSWKKIDVEPPAGFSWDRLQCCMKGGVCVNSVVHIMAGDMSLSIVAFNFITEKFSFVNNPQGVDFMKRKETSIRKIGGCLGVLFHDRGSSEVHIWLLKDYDNRVWVNETISFRGSSWNYLSVNFSLPVDVDMHDQIIFSLGKKLWHMILIPIYNRKSRSLKMLDYTFDDQFVCSNAVTFKRINCYVESILPITEALPNVNLFSLLSPSYY